MEELVFFLIEKRFFKVETSESFGFSEWSSLFQM